MADTTTIEIREDQADALHELKERGDSYKDVLDRILALADDLDRGAVAVLQPDEGRADRREAVEDLDIPGQGEVAEQRREAVRAVREHLERAGRVKKAELVEVGDEIAGETYADGHSLWKNLLQPALSKIEGVESEGASGYWRAAGETGE